MKFGLSLVLCVIFMSVSFGSASGTELGNAVKGVTDALNAVESAKEPVKEKSETDKAENVGTEENADASDKSSLGIKEALTVGISEAVKQVGSENGFYKNDAIKIRLPESLQKADAVVRRFGGEELSESLVLKMNQAAEKAAPRALDIFVSAISSMKIEDAMNLLSGEDNAATAYLEKNTWESLQEAFYPIVKETMEEVGAVKIYNDYIGKVASNPLMKMADTDISQYVTGKSLDGLFSIVAEEEKKIRQNPAARTTDLLKDVFGNLGN